MKNCLIMGFGRSGTSLMGGILYHSGYHLGNDLYQPRISNPKGFFENALINGINEKILEKFDFSLSHLNGPVFPKKYSPYKPGTGHRWLSFIPPETTIFNEEESINNEILQSLSVVNFAYKDPRFNYTISVWNKFLHDDSVIICMFRQPGIVVESVLQECQTADYLSDFYIDSDIACSLWENNYYYILNQLSTCITDRILFVHYEQLLNRQAWAPLCERLDTDLHFSFISPDLNRSHQKRKVPDSVTYLYNKLCELSDYPKEK